MSQPTPSRPELPVPELLVPELPAPDVIVGLAGLLWVPVEPRSSARGLLSEVLRYAIAALRRRLRSAGQVTEPAAGAVGAARA